MEFKNSVVGRTHFIPINAAQHGAQPTPPPLRGQAAKAAKVGRQVDFRRLGGRRTPRALGNSAIHYDHCKEPT